MSSWQLRVGAVQLRSTPDLATNLAVCRELVGRAATDGAQLVVLPECFAFLGRGEGDKLPIVEALEGDGPVMATLRGLASTHGIWLVGGGTPERVAEDPKRAYNTAVVIDPGGALVSRYRKIHLFDVDIPGGATLRESDATAAGGEPVVVEIAGAKVGLSICYDVRFPELYRILAKERGAEVLLVPAAFTAHTGAAHWHVLLRARAIENQAYVVAAAQWGRHNDKRESYGHSMIVDPWGTIVDERAEGDGVVVATLEGAVIDKRRSQMPCLEHAVLWK
ncbi:MAG: Nitrilase/cyanide hydratase and apolipoprotein N-acyltransferase [Deltaproteobacteria bacterium]|nr:Nitrilase/cyanide hydratase and apolipoprotein N-acyltransferase [Deltaproteobacteria bacterium]